FFIGRFAVDHLFVDASNERVFHDLLALCRSDRANLSARWHDPGPFHHCRLAIGSNNEISASPTANWVSTDPVSSLGFGRNVSAAALTSFWSAGVKARNACCTRLPNWPSTWSGMSRGFWLTK